MDKLKVKFNFPTSLTRNTHNETESEKKPQDKAAAERQRKCRAKKAVSTTASQVLKQQNVSYREKYRRKSKRKEMKVPALINNGNNLNGSVRQPTARS